MPTINLTVNGKPVSGVVDSRTLLVSFLRDHLRLTGTHVGCDTSQCGACVVHVDGRAVKSCTMLAAQADGRTIVTIEGLGDYDKLDPLQEAFIAEGAVQCGFCTPGMILSAKALLDDNPQPTREEILTSISGNLCRCTGYQKIANAIERVANSRGE